MQPTDEQQQAIDLFTRGGNIAVEAGAGTGKTTTLVLMAEQTQRPGAYLAFNRSIVEDSARKLPGNVTAKTVHSYAMAAIGSRFRHRLGGARLSSSRQASLLRIDPITIRYGNAAKVLQPGFLVGRVMAGLRNFCQSADPEPRPDHIPYIDGIDEPLGPGRPGRANNELVRQHLAGPLERAWADAQDPDGKLRYDHAWYLKMWQLSEPRIPADFVMFDEAQDASPVMLSIVEQQARHAQLVYVGDSQQQIYDWLGAVNALQRIPDAERTWLTQSFRFGPAVADVANDVLARLHADLRIVGSAGVDSHVVDGMLDPSCVLTRTNAAAVRRLFEALDWGLRAHLVGGGDEVLRFARAAEQLQDEGWTPHPDLACFNSWQEVQDYVAQDEQGADMALLVKLIDEYGADHIAEALEAQVPEAVADLVVSTAHKAKGREWSAVQLADDFPESGEDEPLSDPELRLLYVAATRAQHELDVSAVAELQDSRPMVAMGDAR